MSIALPEDKMETDTTTYINTMAASTTSFDKVHHYLVDVNKNDYNLKN